MNEVSTSSILKDVEDIQKVFNKYGVRLFVLYGALLGLYRDRKLIPYDDDIDFGIIDPINLETRKKLGWALTDLGFKVQEIAFNVFGRWEQAEAGYNGNEKTGIMVLKRNFDFTFFFYEEVDCSQHGKEYVCTPRLGSYPLISMPTEYFKNTDTIKFGKLKLLTPKPIHEYLTWTYGNYKIPEKGKHAQQWKEAHNVK